MGKKGKQWQIFLFLGSKITVDGDCSHEFWRCLFLGRKDMTNLDSVLKNQRHHFADKGPYSQICGFSSSHVQMWELDHKEAWMLNNWCFWIVVLEKILENPLDSKEIKPINPKENKLWIFTERTKAEAETPMLWPPDTKSWLIGKDWCWERLKAKGEEDGRGQDVWMASADLMDMNLGEFWEMVRDREAWHAIVHGVTKSWTQLRDWTIPPVITQGFSNY